MAVMLIPNQVDSDPISIKKRVKASARNYKSLPQPFDLYSIFSFEYF
jgi:hypothetical protein